MLSIKQIVKHSADRISMNVRVVVFFLSVLLVICVNKSGAFTAGATGAFTIRKQGRRSEVRLNANISLEQYYASQPNRFP